MLEWIKKPESGAEDPMRNPATASAMLAELRERDPVTALDELGGWLGTIDNAPDFDERARTEVLSVIQEAGAAHVAKLARRYLADAAEKQMVRETKWKAMLAYATRLAETLGASAERLQALTQTDATAAGAAAGGSVRALRACRLLAKICLIHYVDVPASLWQRAYALHAHAEASGCAATAVNPHRSQRISTTATEEFLRLLMLHVAAPEALASEQIEIADRAMEQLGGELTLRPRGVADNSFCFDPESDGPPRRATAEAQISAMRFFGPGVALDTLARLHKQLATAGDREPPPFGSDIAAHAQIAAVEHLLRHWGPKPPQGAPAHAPAKGELLLVHGFAAVHRHLASGDAKVTESRGLELTDDDAPPPQPPETWTIRGTGGNEVGAELTLPAANWARSGMLVTFCVAGRNEWWLGTIRRTHADIDKSMRVDIGPLSRQPSTVSLRPQATADAGGAEWKASAGTFAFVKVDAILLPDTSQASGTPNILLSPETWKEGRVYEAMLAEGPRNLRLVRVLQRGEDFVRAAFEWLPVASG